jgi:hypothetical protein
MTSPKDPITSALQRVLAAQHAGVFGYPVIGVHLNDPAQVQAARTLEAAHRASRDELMAQLVARSAQPDLAAANYAPPEKVHDAATAQRWALQLESDCAAGYRYLLASTATGDVGVIRKQAISGLTEAAQQATHWRRALTPATPTVPFPGT